MSDVQSPRTYAFRRRIARRKESCHTPSHAVALACAADSMWDRYDLRDTDD